MVSLLWLGDAELGAAVVTTGQYDAHKRESGDDGVSLGRYSATDTSTPVALLEHGFCSVRTLQSRGCNKCSKEFTDLGGLWSRERKKVELFSNRASGGDKVDAEVALAPTDCSASPPTNKLNIRAQGSISSSWISHCSLNFEFPPRNIACG